MSCVACSRSRADADKLRASLARRSYCSLFLKTIAVLALGVVLGIVAHRVALAHRPARDTAAIELMSGVESDAERRAWELLQKEPPTMDHFEIFLEAHDRAFADEEGEHEKILGQKNGADPAVASEAEHPFVTDEQIAAFLTRPDLPDDFAHLARFAWTAREGVVDPDLEAWVIAAADRDPPVPWANRLLAESAMQQGDNATLAARLVREGKFVPEHRSDIAAALVIWTSMNAWDEIDDAMNDPVVAEQASPAVRARVAIEKNDWLGAVRWSFHTTYSRPPLGPLLLTGIAALAWAMFCAQLGKARERLFFRLSVYAAAFVLGVMSVELTDLLILLEESKLHLVESGEPVRDFLFYTFGVGFREEISKLVMFAPLLLVLRKNGKKSDVLVAGAFVGLGFAAVENILYLQSGDLTTAIGRFLTANFLHMAMTAILANALHEMIVKGDEYAPELSRTALMVMGLHGLYDFFIAHPKIGGGYLSMLVFFILVNRFIVAIDMARGRSEPNEKLLDTFVLGIAVVLSAGYVWASILVGPSRAAVASGEGILGSAILMIVFAQRFRSM